jgi:acetoacetyl-CoA reductase/3-oxoacyl-[acyl-carrier protein] reductase
MIIITGASRGLGRYLFEQFSNEGFEVIGTYNSSSSEISKDSERYFKVDVSNYDSVRSFIELINEKCTNIILLNCAGISYNAFAHKADIEKWSKVIDVNLKGTFNIIHELLPLMRYQNYGRIINFSSVVTSLPTPGTSAYTASKAAILGLTKTLAVENASKGITVNAIKLGYVNIGMGINDVPKEYYDKIINQIPAGRFCEPGEVYKTIKYIINTEYLNGAAIDLNGGLI